MGNHISHPVATSVDALIDEVPTFVLEKRVGSARFFKTLRGRYNDGQPTIIKVFVKPEMDFDVQMELRRAQSEAQALRDAPYTCAYSQIFETAKAVFLCRPYFHSNLYDRMSTRPFLNSLERKWMTFQLLSAVAHMHSLKIHHGDIKTENVMITSWNGVYLTDVASFKPTCLPIDNPADYVYYFDASSRRTCYLAPERFQDEAESAVELTDAMDMFSVGCVIAELFLDEQPIFNLSQLFKFKKGEYDPMAQVASIRDELVIDMIRSLIALRPEQRMSASSLLQAHRGKVFPEEFYTWMRPFSLKFAEPSLDFLEEPCPGSLPFSVADLRILYVMQERTKLNIPMSLSALVLGHVTSCFRSLLYPRTQLMAVALVLYLAQGITDEQRLDWAVTSLCWLLQAASTHNVRAQVLEALTELMGTVQNISSEDVGLFTEVLFPLFKSVVTDPEPLVRATFAECLADLADTCVRFLEIAQTVKEEETAQDESALYNLQTYDVILADVQQNFLEHLQALITDENVHVRRAILSQVSRLCVFFGRQTANDVILSHTITYLNDKDAHLRSAFFESMAGVGAVAGEKSLQEYVLPLLFQSLHDSDHCVVERVLNALSFLLESRMFQKFQVRQITRHTAPYLFHPNIFLRYSCVAVICACSRALEPLDVACLMSAILQDYLKFPPPMSAIDSASLLKVLKPPSQLQRSTLDAALKDKIDLKHHFNISQDELKKLEIVRKALPIASLSWSSNYRSHERADSMPYEDSVSLQSLSITPHTVFFPSGVNYGISERSRAAVTTTGIGRIHPMIVSSLERKLVTQSSEPNLRRQISMVSPKAGQSQLGSRVASDAALLTLKAVPETSTVNATVTASLAQPSSRQARGTPRSGHQEATNGELHRISRVLDPSGSPTNGNNAFIRELLASKSQEIFPTVDVSSPHAVPCYSSDVPVLNGWRPSGTLLAHLHDHTGPVHSLATSKDGTLLISASEDGKIKAWEVARVHKNLAVKARITHHVGGAVRSVIFLNSSNCIACASETGNLQVIALDLKGRTSRVIRDIKLPGESCVAVAHMRSDLESILLVATATGHIYGFDPLTVAFVMQTPPAYGIICSILLDRNCNWLLVGTLRGILLVYDLRLRLLVVKWTHPSRSRIHALAHHPTDPTLVVIAAGRSECSVWNLRTKQCMDVFTRFPPANSYHAMSPPKPDDFIQNSSKVFQETQASDGLYALAAATATRSSTSSKSKHQEACELIFCGGTDRKLRYWEVATDNAHVFSGQKEDERDAVYEYIKVVANLY